MPSSLTTISLIGPGAIGGTLAAWLATKPRNAVSICARTPFTELVVEAPSRTLATVPTLFTDPSEPSPVDWVIVATKTYQIPSAAKWLEKLVHPSTRIAVVQNGVEHISNLAPYVDTSRIVPVIIDCPAERQAPGRILQRANIYMAVPNTQDAADFAALFEDPNIEITLTDSWLSAAWQKLCTNSAGAICALVNQPANIAKDPQAADIMRALIRECIAVGRAEGAEIDDAIVENVIASQQAAPDGAMNSIHADLVARRPMEWDARNGVIARLGQKHGIPTPYNQMAAQILSLLEGAYL